MSENTVIDLTRARELLEQKNKELAFYNNELATLTSRRDTLNRNIQTTMDIITIIKTETVQIIGESNE